MKGTEGGSRAERVGCVDSMRKDLALHVCGKRGARHQGGCVGCLMVLSDCASPGPSRDEGCEVGSVRYCRDVLGLNNDGFDPRAKQIERLVPREEVLRVFGGRPGAKKGLRAENCVDSHGSPDHELMEFVRDMQNKVYRSCKSKDISFAFARGILADRKGARIDWATFAHKTQAKQRKMAASWAERHPGEVVSGRDVSGRDAGREVTSGRCREEEVNSCDKGLRAPAAPTVEEEMGWQQHSGHGGGGLEGADKAHVGDDDIWDNNRIEDIEEQLRRVDMQRRHWHEEYVKVLQASLQGLKDGRRVAEMAIQDITMKLKDGRGKLVETQRRIESVKESLEQNIADRTVHERRLQTLVTDKRRLGTKGGAVKTRDLSEVTTEKDLVQDLLQGCYEQSGILEQLMSRHVQMEIVLTHRVEELDRQLAEVMVDFQEKDARVEKASKKLQEAGQMMLHLQTVYNLVKQSENLVVVPRCIPQPREYPRELNPPETVTIRPCPMCSRWFYCGDWVGASCGCVYHLHCAALWFKQSNKCCKIGCGKNMHPDWLTAWGKQWDDEALLTNLAKNLDEWRNRWKDDYRCQGTKRCRTDNFSSYDIHLEHGGSFEGGRSGLDTTEELIHVLDSKRMRLSEDSSLACNQCMQDFIVHDVPKLVGSQQTMDHDVHDNGLKLGESTHHVLDTTEEVANSLQLDGSTQLVLGNLGDARDGGRQRAELDFSCEGRGLQDDKDEGGETADYVAAMECGCGDNSDLGVAVDHGEMDVLREEAVIQNDTADLGSGRTRDAGAPVGVADILISEGNCQEVPETEGVVKALDIAQHTSAIIGEAVLQKHIGQTAASQQILGQGVEVAAAGGPPAGVQWEECNRGDSNVAFSKGVKTGSEPARELDDRTLTPHCFRVEAPFQGIKYYRKTGLGRQRDLKSGGATVESVISEGKYKERPQSENAPKRVTSTPHAYTDFRQEDIDVNLPAAGNEEFEDHSYVMSSPCQNLSSLHKPDEIDVNLPAPDEKMEDAEVSEAAANLTAESHRIDAAGEQAPGGQVSLEDQIGKVGEERGGRRGGVSNDGEVSMESDLCMEDDAGARQAHQYLVFMEEFPERDGVECVNLQDPVNMRGQVHERDADDDPIIPLVAVEDMTGKDRELEDGHNLDDVSMTTPSQGAEMDARCRETLHSSSPDDPSATGERARRAQNVGMQDSDVQGAVAPIEPASDVKLYYQASIDVQTGTIALDNVSVKELTQDAEAVQSQDQTLAQRDATSTDGVMDVECSGSAADVQVTAGPPAQSQLDGGCKETLLSLSPSDASVTDGEAMDVEGSARVVVYALQTAGKPAESQMAAGGEETRHSSSPDDSTATGEKAAGVQNVVSLLADCHGMLDSDVQGEAGVIVSASVHDVAMLDRDNRDDQVGDNSLDDVDVDGPTHCVKSLKPENQTTAQHDATATVEGERHVQGSDSVADDVQVAVGAAAAVQPIDPLEAPVTGAATPAIRLNAATNAQEVEQSCSASSRDKGMQEEVASEAQNDLNLQDDAEHEVDKMMTLQDDASLTSTPMDELNAGEETPPDQPAPVEVVSEPEQEEPSHQVTPIITKRVMTASYPGEDGAEESCNHPPAPTEGTNSLDHCVSSQTLPDPGEQVSFLGCPTLPSGMGAISPQAGNLIGSRWPSGNAVEDVVNRHVAAGAERQEEGSVCSDRCGTASVPPTVIELLSDDEEIEVIDAPQFIPRRRKRCTGVGLPRWPSSQQVRPPGGSGRFTSLLRFVEQNAPSG